MIEIIRSGVVGYQDAEAFMDDRVGRIRSGEADECLWLLEHPSLYTAGTSANPDDLIDPRFPVYRTGRGGQYTYHGPGQRVAYVMLDLKKNGDAPDLKRYIYGLEQWLIDSLSEFGISGERREGRVGIWVNTEAGEKKIAAIGVRIRQWVSFHGISLNVSPDLSHFGGIVPCGIKEYGVTSFRDLGKDAGLEELDGVLIKKFQCVFGRN